jgi:hypothetical protein
MLNDSQKLELVKLQDAVEPGEEVSFHLCDNLVILVSQVDLAGIGTNGEFLDSISQRLEELTEQFL